MDVNEGNHDLDDTIDSIDDVGVGNSREVNGNVEEINGNVPEPVAYPVENTDGSPAKPLLKDPVTGKFIKGTGGSGKGGRPVGAKDKITTQMIALAQQTIEEHGVAMWNTLAKNDPTACLALISRLLPNADLSRAIEGESGGSDAITQISINLVSKTTEERIASPVSRITHADVPLDSVIEQAAEEAAVKPVQEPPEPTQEQLDREAERVEVERVARRNDTVKAHGGLTGRPKRRDPGSTLDYPDEPVI